MPVEALAAVTGTATMEITVSKFELLRELTATQGVVERKTTIPILSNQANCESCGGGGLQEPAAVHLCSLNGEVNQLMWVQLSCGLLS